MIQFDSGCCAGDDREATASCRCTRDHVVWIGPPDRIHFGPARDIHTALNLDTARICVWTLGVGHFKLLGRRGKDRIAHRRRARSSRERRSRIPGWGREREQGGSCHVFPRTKTFSSNPSTGPRKQNPYSCPFTRAYFLRTCTTSASATSSTPTTTQPCCCPTTASSSAGLLSCQIRRETPSQLRHGAHRALLPRSQET